jgi:hypothetical protein
MGSELHEGPAAAVPRRSERVTDRVRAAARWVAASFNSTAVACDVHEVDMEALHQPHVPSAPTLARRILAPCPVDTTMIEPVEPLLLRPPVEPVGPVLQQSTQVVKVSVLRPRPPRRRIGPARASNALPQIVENCVGHRDGERLTVGGDGLDLAGL